LLLGTIFYFVVYKKYSIDFNLILKENFIIFVCVGIIEFLFFNYIASKYVPVTPDFVATSILERIKLNIKQS
jgi:hypothetical protein